MNCPADVHPGAYRFALNNHRIHPGHNLQNMVLPDISRPDITHTDITELDKLLGRMRGLAALLLSAGNLVTEPVAPIPAGFIPATEKAMAHATWFTSRYFPETGNIISSLVSGFNIIFQDRAGAICRVFETGANSYAEPVGDKRIYVDGLLNELINHMEWEKEKADSMNRRLKVFSTQMRDDTVPILAAMNRVINMAEDGAELFEVIDPLLRKQFNHQPLQLNPQMLNGYRPLLAAAVLTKAVFLYLCELAAAAQEKMQEVAAAWAVMLKKYSALIAGLDNATDEEYTASFNATGMTAALNHWQQLAAINTAANIHY